MAGILLAKCNSKVVCLVLHCFVLPIVQACRGISWVFVLASLVSCVVQSSDEGAHLQLLFGGMIGTTALGVGGLVGVPKGLDN